MGEGEGAKGGAPKPAAKPEPPKLPDNTPDPIKKFVACQANGIRFRGGPLPFVKGNPRVTFEPGDKAGTVKVTVGWGMASLSVTAEVKDGQLSIDSSQVPDLSDFIDGAPRPQDFKDFTDKLNEWLKANGKKLAPLELKDGQLSIRKQAIPAAGRAAAPGGAAPAPAPAPKPKEEGIKTGPGMGARTATGVGTFVLGFTIGALAAPGGDQVTQGQPDDPVPVVRAQQEPQPMPVERVILQLPPGDVQGEITITGPPGSFTTPAVFRQTGDRLTLELPQSGLPPFKGPIDEAVEFEIRNQSGMFAGRFEGDRVSGDHEFQGEPFTFEGTIEKPVVEKIVTDGPPPQEAVPVAGGIGEGVTIQPAETNSESDANVSGAVAGGALALVGAGLVLGAGRSLSRDCSEQQATLQSAITDHGKAVDRLQNLEAQLKGTADRLAESRGKLEAMAPGRAEVRETGFSAELVPAPEAVLADLVASRPGTDEAINDAVFGHGLGLKTQQELRMQRAQAERAVAEAAAAVGRAEAALARCEGRSPRSLEEALRDRPQPPVVETREVM